MKLMFLLTLMIVYYQGARLQPLNKYSNRSGSQTGHYLNPDAVWPYQSHNKQDMDSSRHIGSVSGTDIRGGWMSRPQSVLGDDGDVYIQTPRDQELKPIRSGKARGGGYADLRGLRDGNT